jgi:hypothetical protein
MGKAPYAASKGSKSPAQKICLYDNQKGKGDF